ncbi:MAG: AAA family ATPase [Leptospiraceae bacterium]|nr:AAA family ATPase [Leptospiraceae bacterium]
MWIKKIKIENLRCFENAEIEFSKGINILLGANNSGKSTILLSMLTLQHLDMYISKDDIRKRSNSLNITYEFADMSKKYFNQFNVNYIDVGLSKGLDRASAIQPVNQSKNNPHHVDSLEKYAFKSFHATNQESLIIEKLYKNPMNQKINFLFSNEPNNFIYPFVSKRKVSRYSTDVSLNSANRIAKDSDNLPARVDLVLNSALPEFHEFKIYCEDVLEISITAFSFESGKNVGLSIQSDIHIPMQQMGEGSSIVGLLVHLCLAKEGYLFIIEEIENDLHPKALKKLLEIIKEKSKTNQFIISTHSHIVAKYLGSEENSKLFEVSMSLVDRMPTSKVSLIETPEERINALEKLGYEFNDYGLTKGWLILEESSAQKIIESFLIPWFVLELQNQIRVIASNGFQNVEDKFIFLHNHFLFIHLQNNIYLNKAWVIIDAGLEEEEVIKSLKNKFCDGENKLWKENHFLNWKEHDFESYYPIHFKERIELVNQIDKKDKKKKREAKEKLLKDVIAWSEKNKEEAKKQFNESAKEVIDKLQLIAKELNLLS